MVSRRASALCSSTSSISPLAPLSRHSRPTTSAPTSRTLLAEALSCRARGPTRCASRALATYHQRRTTASASLPRHERAMYLTSRWRLCFRAASVAGLTIVGASCGDSTGPSKTKNRPVLTTHLDSIFAIEETVRLTSQPADVVWASRDVSVARVSQDGIVTAKSVGDTWVLVVSDDGGA